MDKENIVYTHTHTEEWYSAIKKEGNPAICDNMDGVWGHYAEWNKSARERQILPGITHT